MFTARQLLVLSSLSDLVGEACEVVRLDAVAAGMPDDGIPLVEGGVGAKAYADAMAVYLGFSVSKTANRTSTLCPYMVSVQCPGHTFGRQALPMIWDYAEANTVGGPSGSFESMVKNVVSGLLSNGAKRDAIGHTFFSDATSQSLSLRKIVSTDPPYYDNVPYADLSDYFYIWLRHSLGVPFPDLFATLATPKSEELVAAPYRHGGKDNAETFFLDGMKKTMRGLALQTSSLTVFY